jgi:hypothetical protein
VYEKEEVFGAASSFSVAGFQDWRAKNPKSREWVQQYCPRDQKLTPEIREGRQPANNSRFLVIIRVESASHE